MTGPSAQARVACERDAAGPSDGLTTHPPDPADYADAPLAVVLGRAAAEAVYLASGLGLLERQIGSAVHQMDSEVLAELQQIDALRQGIEGLARFLAGIAGQLDPAVTCGLGDAAATLTMQAQAQRLMVSPDGSAQITPAPELWCD